MTTARPILFSAPMIRALLAGTKTQTRRIAKHPLLDDVPGLDDVVHQNPRQPAPYLDSYCGGARTPGNPRGMTEWWCWWTRDDRPCHQFKCPYGKPGDLLWVRETFAQVTGFPPTARYYATDDIHELRRKRPGIHMPRWASRLTLELTDVRVERLQDISEADATAEGCKVIRDNCHVFEGTGYDKAGLCHSAASTAYAVLWNEINDADGKRWSDNPWVWALTFNVHKFNVDAFLSTQRSEAAA